jgi:transcriptional regulator with XRE-family HTH domain
MLMNISILGQNVKRLRLARGKTQEELAPEIGITVRSLSSLENGVGNPGIKTLQAIADALKVESMLELIGD